jgi:hypothetical protein
MSATKRKLPTPTKPKIHLLRRLPTRSRRWQYAENTDSDSDGYVGGSPLLATVQSKAGSGRAPAKQENLEDSYFDGSGDDENDATEKDNVKLGHKGALTKQGGGDTGDNALPSVTIIPLERMRGPGSTEYVDFRLHPNRLMFLTELKVNNNRAWLKSKSWTINRRRCLFAKAPKRMMVNTVEPPRTGRHLSSGQPSPLFRWMTPFPNSRPKMSYFVYTGTYALVRIKSRTR